MRIDAYNKISQIYQSNSVKKVNAVNGVKAKDKVEISRIGRDYQVAKTAVNQTEDVRQDKINEIKNRLASGTYDVTAKELVDKLVDSYYDSSI